MSMLGMDVTGVQQIVSRLQQQVNALEHVRSTVTSTVNSADAVWKGPDVKKFQADWQAHQASLKQAEQAINELITKARQNIAQQQSTSNSY